MALPGLLYGEAKTEQELLVEIAIFLLHHLWYGHSAVVENGSLNMVTRQHFGWFTR